MSGLFRRPCQFVLVFLLALFLAAPGLRASAESDEPTPHTTSLVPLYISFAALQALDVHSTLNAIHAGAQEGNPMMASVVSSPPAVIASKAAATVGIVFLTEKLKKQHPRAAFVTMVALNSACAAVVANNYAVLRSTR